MPGGRPTAAKLVPPDPVEPRRGTRPAQRQVEQARSANAAAQSQLSDATARLTLAQKQLENARITAPFSGVVSERTANVGDVVAPGTPLITIVDPSSMRLEASVPAINSALQRRYESSAYARNFLERQIAKTRSDLDRSERQLVAYAQAQGIISTGTRPATILQTSVISWRRRR